MKAGFVNIFGKPNAGKSTLLNSLMGEKLAIVSPKVQTTRHRIKTILTGDNYQVIFSDTPGIIEPKYKLHEKMMQAVKSSLEDADVAIFLFDVTDSLADADQIFSSLGVRVPVILVINKTDIASKEKVTTANTFFSAKDYVNGVVEISASKGAGVSDLLKKIIELLPEGEAFYSDENLSDLPTKFFVGEIIREKIFYLYQEEIPYHATVLVQEFKEKTTLTKIRAEIIVQRETQKGIILGEKGKMIKELGTLARIEIEEFIGRKVFLELFVKVRPKWRDSELYLREYGY
jgi:GTP-binding protein Era